MVVITFRTVFGRFFQLDVSPDSSVWELKSRVQEQEQFGPGFLEFVLGSKLLSDSTLIKDLRFAPGASIIIHPVVPRRRRPPPIPPPPRCPAPSPIQPDLPPPAPPSVSPAPAAKLNATAPATVPPQVDQQANVPKTDPKQIPPPVSLPANIPKADPKQIPPPVSLPPNIPKPDPKQISPPANSSANAPKSDVRQAPPPANSPGNIPQAEADQNPPPAKPPPSSSHHKSSSSKRRSHHSFNPDYSELRNQLTEMGFDSATSEQALVNTKGNLESAIAYLLSIGDVASTSQTQGPPPIGKFGELQGIFESLSSAEKAAVERLCVRYGDPEMAIQMYMACDKNEAQAQALA
jgi:hypothetical protein